MSLVLLLDVQQPRKMSQNAGSRAVAAKAEIKLITTDVDGTLLNSKLELTPKVEKAIKLSQSVGVPVRCPHPTKRLTARN